MPKKKTKKSNIFVGVEGKRHNVTAMYNSFLIVVKFRVRQRFILFYFYFFCHSLLFISVFLFVFFAQDDMEQWVSDTFYSYFPGYNNENQKRQNYLRDRQLEHQQNFLKHQVFCGIKMKYVKFKFKLLLLHFIWQMSHPPPVKHAALKSKDSIAAPHASVNTTARSSATNSSTDKTDLEIIVNNPNYVPSKSTTRPGSTRHKLLQDLRHIELSNIITGDGVLERNRHSAEVG